MPRRHDKFVPRNPDAVFPDFFEDDPPVVLPFVPANKEGFDRTVYPMPIVSCFQFLDNNCDIIFSTMMDENQHQSQLKELLDILVVHHLILIQDLHQLIQKLVFVI